MERTISVFSNQDLEKRSDNRIKFKKFLIPGLSFSSPASIKEFVTALNTASTAPPSAFLIFNPQFKDFLFAFFYKALGGKSKFFQFDALFKKPEKFLDFLYAPIKRLIYSYSDFFVCVHKDISEYQKYFGVKNAIYVPFKANNFEIKDTIETSDGGYILSCGVSHRDYDTLAKATKDLNCRIKVVLPDEKQTKYHRTVLGCLSDAKNIEIIRHDFKKGSWNNYLANASFVVIPIEKNAIQPAGISVYLEAMMLGKAVIISDCPASKDILDENTALIVPRTDTIALRNAIRNLLENKTLREKLGQAGASYANSLQGVDRLIADLKEAIIQRTNC
jgi:glycosyltransferase involved in cell wall biosynthesis